MTAPHGEEWKQMESATRHWNPEAFAGDLESARARIATLRKSDAALRLVDREGKPLAGVEVRIEQTESDFKWGEQLWGLDTIFRNGFAKTDYVRHYTRRFTECLNAANCLTYWTEAPRNDGPKHMEFQGVDCMDGFEDQVNWARQNGLTTKGHPIFWSIPKCYPEWLKRYPIDTQWKFIEVRVRNLVARFKGKVKIWDVVNEPMWEAAPKNLPTRHWPHLESLDDICEYIVPVLRWAREEDPDACFIVNDYGMEMDSPGRDIRHLDGHIVTAKSQRDRFTALFRRLRELGAAPDGLGMQSHTGSWMTPAEQNNILDDFATSGVPLHYTEFWAHNDHLIKAGIDPKIAEEMKADYIAQVMTIAFAHPSVASFFFWGDIGKSFGFRQDHNSNSGPCSSNTPTIVYERARKLLREEWRTRLSAVSDADGCIRFNGFFGDYSLRHDLSPGMCSGKTFSLRAGQSGLQTLVLERPLGA